MSTHVISYIHAAVCFYQTAEILLTLASCVMSGGTLSNFHTSLCYLDA